MTAPIYGPQSTEERAPPPPHRQGSHKQSKTCLEKVALEQRSRLWDTVIVKLRSKKFGSPYFALVAIFLTTVMWNDELQHVRPRECRATIKGNSFRKIATVLEPMQSIISPSHYE